MTGSSAAPNQVAHSVPPHPRHSTDAQRLANSAPPLSDEPYENPPQVTPDKKEIQVSYAESKEPKNEEATVAVPIAAATAAEDDTPPSQSDEDLVGPRQGQKCCYCCCDYRRAVIIINIVIGVLEAIVLIALATGAFSISYYSGGGSTSLNDKYDTIEMIFSGISIVLSSLAIVGAYYYKIILVGLNVLWLVVAYVLGIVLAVQYCGEFCDYYDSDYYYYSYCYCSLHGGTVIGMGAVMCLYAYPHIGFIVQVHKGIMSRETYPREEYSCCCV
jgi:hypothetical protein